MSLSHPMPRSFIRHPSDIPLEVAAAQAPRLPVPPHLKDIAEGGLAFESAVPFETGTCVHLAIPAVQPPFTTRAKVVWCRPHGKCYDVGVQFTAPVDAFAARMVEQICHIEHYRSQVLRNEGRLLDGEEAAIEWISKHAGSFPPAPDDGGV